MAKIKISIVTTVLNEEDSIHALLDSLLNQSRLPDELIVIDGGSTDETINIIKEHSSAAPFPLRVATHKGANRSAGRNIGIKMAGSEHIAVIDAGCEADRDWLKNIEAGFAEGFEVVAGFYLTVIDRPLQRLFIPFLSVSPDRLDAKKFLPSSRSLGFTKKAWQAVGHYPEHLPTCEDLVFADKLRAKHTTVVKTEALVYWHIVRTVGDFFKQIAGYAYGDVLAAYKRHVIKIITMWLRYAIFLPLPYLWLPYFLYRWHLHRDYVRKLSWLPWYAVVMLLADMGVLWGSFKGWVTLMRGRLRIEYAQ